MADNPNKKKEDGKRVSKQPHEVAYQERKEKESSKSGASKTATKKKA